jgi:hypothetical protein
MKVIEHFKTLLQIPDASIALNEARAKLRDTIMRIDGHLMSVATMDFGTLVVHDKDGNGYDLSGDDIKTLEFFLPESGVYFIKDTPIALVKIPKRQWKKSFNWSFYEASKTFNICELDESKCHEIYLHKGTVYYLTTPIGKYQARTDKFICLNSVFENELNTFIKRLKK